MSSVLATGLLYGLLRTLGLSLLRNRGLGAKDILLDLARRCFWQLGRNTRGQQSEVRGQTSEFITVWKWPAAFLEGHTSGPCRWLFLAARPIGDVKSLKALHRYNVLKTPAVGVITV
jgi:hypothetical protein